jgi:hypothetical protein
MSRYETVITDTQRQLEFHWEGSYTINVYSTWNGQEIDVISLDYTKKATYSSVMRAISRYERP